jgi:NitT/TauT family transport system substrate-binding protein
VKEKKNQPAFLVFLKRKIPDAMSSKWIQITVLAFSIAALLFLIQCNQYKNSNKIKVAYLPSIHALPFYLAMEKGYFKEEGLDIEAIRFEAPNQIVDALMNGNIDAVALSGATGIFSIADYRNPGKFKIFALTGGDSHVPNESLLTQSNSSVHSVQDLKGRKMGILPGIQWRTISKHMLSKYNVDPSQVTLIELGLGLQIPALQARQVDALLAIEPIATIAKSRSDVREIVRGPTSETVANPWLGGCGAVNLSFAQQNPELFKRFLKALTKAVKEVQTNPESSKIYNKNYIPMDEKIINKLPVLICKMYNQLTPEDIQAAQKFIDIFTEHKVIDGKIDFQKLIFSENLMSK